jgi:hypothetical protein
MHEDFPPASTKSNRLYNGISTVAIAFIVTLLLAGVAKADGGAEIVNYRCDPKAHLLYVGTAVSYGIISDFGKDIIPLANALASGTKIRECQISKTDKVIVEIVLNQMHPRNNEVKISINDKQLGELEFDPTKDYSYIIEKYNNKKIQVIYSESSITRKVLKWPADVQ